MPDAIPATLTLIGAAVERLLTEHGPLTEQRLLGLLDEAGLDLGRDPEDTLLEVLETDDGPLVLPLADGRQALLPILLMGRVFTHRLSAAEVEHDLLEVVPDLQPVSMLTERDPYHQLVDGEPMVEVVKDFDVDLLAERAIPCDVVPEVALLLPPGRLVEMGAREGDLVGLRVQPDGFELVRIGADQLDDSAVAGLGDRLAEILGTARDGGPTELDIAVWTACADDPALFHAPLPPLGELIGAFGLARSEDQLAPGGFDFAGWRVGFRLGRLQERHGLSDDEALATLVLITMYEQVAELFDAAVEAVDSGQDLTAVLDLAGVTGVTGEPGSTLSPVTGGDVRQVGPDRTVVRDTLPFLVEPAVAEAVLVETIGAGTDGAAALGLFAESLEPMAPRATRVAVRWLQAKALERVGNVAAAEAALDAAESMDPGWPPVLLDLARYASDRGDAERGLDLLRRAGATGDDFLVDLLEHFRPRARTDLGRNQPCWCGSGRKYKQCHLRREQLTLTERAAWLYQKAGMFLSDGPWRDELFDLASVRSAHQDDPGAVLAALNDPLVADAVMFEGGAFAEFLDQRGFLLPDDERLLAEQWLLVDRSVFEVESLRAGQGLSMRDVRTGDRHEVREHTASRQLKVGDLVCARVVPAGDTMQVFGGVEPVGLHEREELVELLDSGPDPEDLVAALSRRFAPPVLQNTEGDPIVLCEARLRVSDPAALAKSLDALYQVDDSDPATRQWHELVTTHGMERLRANLRLKGDELFVDTNSEARMDRVLATLGAFQPAPTMIDQLRRAAEDVREAIGRAGPGGGTQPPGDRLDPSRPEVAAALAQMIRQYEESWLDESIPALAGRTPREAASDPTRRPDLIRLLDSFRPGGEPGQMSPERLRAALGLV